jgi:hypothetical protein
MTKQEIYEFWREAFLTDIAGVDRTDINRACIQLSARRVSYRVKAADPCTIQYWVTRYGISGTISF